MPAELTATDHLAYYGERPWRELNGRFRDECLNQHWFLSLTDARRIIKQWRLTYNTARPHQGPDGRTPSAYAMLFLRHRLLLNCQRELDLKRDHPYP